MNQTANFLPEDYEGTGAIRSDLNDTEARRQSDAFQWFNNSFPALRGLLYHVPNGEARDKVTGARLKAMGVVPGIPDMVFHYRGKTWFFEWKDDKGKVSATQEKIHNLMREQSFIVFIVRTLESFQQTIQQILQDEGRNVYRVGYSKEEYLYRYKVFMYLYTGMGENEIVLLDDLCDPENKIKLIEVVKEFISLRFDEKDGFEILFTEDSEAFYKRMLNRAYEPIFYKGLSIVE